MQKYPNPISHHILSADTVSFRVLRGNAESNYNHANENVASGSGSNNNIGGDYNSDTCTNTGIHNNNNNEVRLETVRVINKRGPKVPAWVKGFIPMKNAVVVESCVVDPVNKTMTTVTRNVSMTSIMTIEETNVYSPIVSDTVKDSTEDETDHVSYTSNADELNQSLFSKASPSATEVKMTVRVAAGPKGLVMQRALESFCLERFKKSSEKSRHALQSVITKLNDHRNRYRESIATIMNKTSAAKSSS